jgi:predicted DNA-binding transcriptional regulator AlpA
MSNHKSTPCSIVCSVRQAADAIGVHPSTVRRWERAGSFAPKVQLGAGRIGFRLTDLETWIAARVSRTA